MPRPIRLAALLLGGFGLFALVLLVRFPARWTVERDARVAAPPAEVYRQIARLRCWEEWSAWRPSDIEGLSYEYDGPELGVGAEQRWDSESTGSGRRTIIEAIEGRGVVVAMESQQGTIQAEDRFTLEATAAGTLLRWQNAGSLQATLLGRLTLPVIEASVATDMERGLERLRLTLAPGSATSQLEAHDSDPGSELDPGSKFDPQ